MLAIKGNTVLNPTFWWWSASKRFLTNSLCFGLVFQFIIFCRWSRICLCLTPAVFVGHIGQIYSTVKKGNGLQKISCNFQFMWTVFRGWCLMLQHSIWKFAKGKANSNDNETREEEKQEWHMKRRAETGQCCYHSRRLESLTRLYQQDGHLISLHSRTTTSVSITDKSYWQLLPVRRG